VADWTSSVRARMRELLLTVSPVGGLPAIAYEGRAYTPVVGTRWIREQLVPISAEVATLGPTGYVREEFVYRLTVYSPLTGSSKLSDHENLVDLIRAKFFPGQEVRDLSSRYFGVVTEAARGYSLSEPDWIGTPVSIRGYFHRATRAA
jgi:Bacteriophage related domain of unknown function